MTEIISSLTTGLTPSVFFAQFAELTPFLIVLVPVALGFMFLRKLIKGASQGKG